MNAVVTAKGDVLLTEWKANHVDIHFDEAINGPLFIGLGWENLWKNQRLI